jgi:uracil-DNA glycosylase family 4
VCCDCPLKDGARNFVPGEGNIDADYMFVGEAPGRLEDIYGVPFYRKAPSGLRLTVLISELLGFDRSDAWVTNLVKYRPPGNRTPRVAEVRACQVHLMKEILDVRPKVIVTLGGPAAKWFDKSLVLSKDHGMPKPWVVYAAQLGEKGRQQVERIDTTLVPMYHPAYTIRNPTYWPVLTEDFKHLTTRLESHAVGAPAYSLGSNALVTELICS